MPAYASLLALASRSAFSRPKGADIEYVIVGHGIEIDAQVVEHIE